MIRNTTNTVLAWEHATDSEISKRFHNLLLRQDVVFTQELHVLHNLFAEQAPKGNGLYNHHDGWRT